MRPINKDGFPLLGEKRYLVFPGYYFWKQEVFEGTVSEIRDVSLAKGKRVDITVSFPNRADKTLEYGKFKRETFETKEEAEAYRKGLIIWLSKGELARIQSGLSKYGISLTWEVKEDG